MTVVDEQAQSVERIAPDPKFTKELVKLGGNSVKKCFQCGTCSVVCNLSPAPDSTTFPRKEMLWAQWGLKDRLLSDPSIWLCHQCSDCSSSCPRGGNPGDTLAAVRAYQIMHFAVPRFIGKAFANPLFLPLIFGIPALLLYAYLVLAGVPIFPKGEVYYNGFIPDAHIEIAAYVVVGLVLVASGISMLRFWRNLSRLDFSGVRFPNEPPRASGKGLVGSFVDAAVEILKHSNFALCSAERNRYLAHLGIFYGTPFLLVAAGMAAIYTWTGRDVAIPLDDPVKIFGNIGAILLFGGINLVVYNRLSRKENWGRATYFDWFFIGIVYITTLTGIVLEVVRFSGLVEAAYALYLVHLVIVFTLFAYAPYGKFAHVFYRTLAITYAKRQGKTGSFPAIVQVAAALSIAIGAIFALLALGLVLGQTSTVAAAPGSAPTLSSLLAYVVSK